MLGYGISCPTCWPKICSSPLEHASIGLQAQQQPEFDIGKFRAECLINLDYPDAKTIEGEYHRVEEQKQIEVK